MGSALGLRLFVTANPATAINTTAPTARTMIGVELDGGDRARMAGAPAINHTDEELEFLARLIGERTAWQISGKKGTKGGAGYKRY